MTDVLHGGERHRCLMANTAGGAASRVTARQRSPALRFHRAVLVCVVGLLLSLGTASAWAATPYVDGIADQNLGQWSGNYLDSSGLFSIPFPSFFANAVQPRPTRNSPMK